MILSTCGASAAGFHTTSFAWRAAWARRTSHQGAVVVRTVAVFPAVFKISRRVGMLYSLSFHSSERQPLDHPTLEDEKHEHRGRALMTVEAISGPQKNTSCDMKF